MKLAGAGTAIALFALLSVGTASAAAAAPMAVQPDGKIVVAGGVAPGFGMVARLTPDGDLDPSFGDGGIAIDRNSTPFTEVVVQPDGKIVALSSSARLSRYQADGSPDLGFGTDGKAVRRGAEGDPAHIALLPDGRIALASTDVRLKIPPRQEAHTYVFAADGRSAEPVSEVGLAGPLDALASRGDGSLFAVGFISPSTSPHEESQGFLVRLVPGGDSLYDPAFGDGAGMVPVSYSGTLPFLYALHPVAEGIYMAGSGGGHVVLARFSEEGVLDGGFGSGGFADASPGPGSSWATDLAVQPDGKVVAAATVSSKTDSTAFYCESCSRPLLLRFLPSGVLDLAFGEDGVVRLTDPDGRPLPAKGQAVASLADGRTLIAGRRTTGSRGRIVVARVERNGELDRSFGDEGIATVEACTGPPAIQRRLGCLPSVRARLRVRRLSGPGVALRLRISPSLSWARVTGFELTLPRQLKTIVGRGRRIGTTLVGEGGRQRPVRVAMARRKLSGFFRSRGSQAISLDVPAGVLKRTEAVPAGRKLLFRLAVSFRAGSFGYDEAGTHVVLLRRALG
jgi:uncharacterized delta-60 repeat protein